MDDRRLRKFFHFTEDDLAANRRGQFSENQKKRLGAEAGKERKSSRESATILFVIAAAGMALGITIGSIAPTLPGRLAILLLMGILWPSEWAGKGVQILRAANVLQEPRLHHVSGQVHVRHHGEGEFTVQIGELESDIDGNPTGALVDGDKCTIYYVEVTEEILSLDY